MRIRAAVPDEAALLTELALRSKAYWGYDAEFMARCRAVLTVEPEHVRAKPIYVAEEQGVVVGFYSLCTAAGGHELDLLFVAPERIRSGVGASLLAHALAQARAAHSRQLLVESDPQAEGFYARHGAVRVGARESSVQAGRLLPVLAFDLSRSEHRRPA